MHIHLWLTFFLTYICIPNYHWSYIPLIYLAIYPHYCVHSDSWSSRLKTRWWVSWQQQSDSNAFHLQRTKTLRWKHYAFAALQKLIFLWEMQMYLCLKCLLMSGFQGVREYNYYIKKMLRSKQRLSIYELELHNYTRHVFWCIPVSRSLFFFCHRACQDQFN